jgi:hypothetical protein
LLSLLACSKVSQLIAGFISVWAERPADNRNENNTKETGKIANLMILMI